MGLLDFRRDGEEAENLGYTQRFGTVIWHSDGHENWIRLQ
jgi:hypothetical protein